MYLDELLNQSNQSSGKNLVYRWNKDELKSEWRAKYGEEKELLQSTTSPVQQDGLYFAV